MCGIFDNNCTALHFGTVNILITTGTDLGQISAMGPGQRSSVMGTRLPKHTFHKETVYIFLPSNIQQPMCSAGCLMGERAFKDTAKKPCLNVILGELMT